VAENNTYDGMWRPYDPSWHDRIAILEDADGDGRADRRTVFWDKAERLTSVEIGFVRSQSFFFPISAFVTVGRAAARWSLGFRDGSRRLFRADFVAGKRDQEGKRADDVRAGSHQ
jgi:hypothetical protein